MEAGQELSTKMFKGGMNNWKISSPPQLILISFSSFLLLTDLASFLSNV